jgi:hypothetical protein
MGVASLPGHAVLLGHALHTSSRAEVLRPAAGHAQCAAGPTRARSVSALTLRSVAATLVALARGRAAGRARAHRAGLVPGTIGPLRARAVARREADTSVRTVTEAIAVVTLRTRAPAGRRERSGDASSGGHTGDLAAAAVAELARGASGRAEARHRVARLALRAVCRARAPMTHVHGHVSADIHDLLDVGAAVLRRVHDGDVLRGVDLGVRSRISPRLQKELARHTRRSGQAARRRNREEEPPRAGHPLPSLGLASSSGSGFFLPMTKATPIDTK